MGKVEEIGKLAVYLCVEEASFITGTDILIRWWLVCPVGAMFLASSAGLALAGCSAKRKRRCVIPKATSHMLAYGAEGSYDAGARIQCRHPVERSGHETDFSRQIQIVDSMVAQRVDGIASRCRASERRSMTSVDRASASNIPVTVFDSGLDTTDYVSYVATDNVEAGRVAARTLIELLGGKGKASASSSMRPAALPPWIGRRASPKASASEGPACRSSGASMGCRIGPKRAPPPRTSHRSIRTWTDLRVVGAEFDRRVARDPGTRLKDKVSLGRV